MQRAGWVSMAVVPDFGWPDRAVEVAYAGREFLLLPGTAHLACCAAVRTAAGESLVDAGEVLLRLLSAYAWSEDAAIALLTGVSFAAFSGETPLREGRARFGASTWQQVSPRSDLYLPAPGDPSARLALALYREGMSVNSYPFALLSYMKILNLKHATGAGQKQWINQALGHLTGPAATHVAALQAQGHDVGEYLYKHGRCAVAHAFDPPVVDPDKLGDLQRMREDLPLARALAAHALESEFGVLKDLTFRLRHQNDRVLPADWLHLVDTGHGTQRYVH